MAITVNWIDRNITVDKFRVYRASSPILDGALPAVLAEVPAGTFSYFDSTAVRNQVYHYRVSSVVGTEETLSVNMPLAYMPYTGPGPQKLQRGDWSYGCFGRMSIEDLFSPAELLAACNLPSSAIPTGVGIPTCWVKLVYNGKILYIPDLTCGTGLTMTQLYQAGVVYGTDDQTTWSQALKTNLGVVPQNVRVQKNTDQFIVRLPGSRVGTLTASAVPANQYGGELDLAISPFYLQRTYNVQPVQLDDLIWPAGIYAVTKDVTTTAGDNFIHRGGATAYVDQIYIGLWNATSAQFGWHPVLELVL